MADPLASAESAPPPAGQSAVSWGAVIAGALVAAAISFVLLILGSGLGLALASPWSAPSLAAFGVMAGIWFIIVQWLSAALGGYLTGRLRTRWTGLHTHEVFFRDTAHGFLAWALSTVLAAAVLIAAGSVGAGARARDAEEPAAIGADALLRTTSPELNAASAPNRTEVAGVLARATANGGLAPDDRRYLGELVAARTGLSLPESEDRVDAAVIQVKTAADAARKAASATAIFTALAMLVGAFVACVGAALGGQQRDEHP
ncbi:MAG: hypothetical protein JO303_16380 [Caulobacteraceae bacterium]|nr:hypothetical protein [Caulobacteraceae bacterium]